MKWKNTWKSRASSPSQFHYRSHKKAVSSTMTTTKVRSVALICCAPADDVTNLCVILASHPHKPSPPSVLSSLAFVSFLLIPGSLFVSQFPCVFVPNLLPRPLASLSLSVSVSHALLLLQCLFLYWLCLLLPPYSNSLSCSFPADRCTPSLRLVVLSNHT